MIPVVGYCSPCCRSNWRLCSVCFIFLSVIFGSLHRRFRFLFYVLPWYSRLCSVSSVVGLLLYSMGAANAYAHWLGVCLVLGVPVCLPSPLSVRVPLCLYGCVVRLCLLHLLVIPSVSVMLILLPPPPVYRARLWCCYVRIIYCPAGACGYCIHFVCTVLCHGLVVVYVSSFLLFLLVRTVISSSGV